MRGSLRTLYSIPKKQKARMLKGQVHNCKGRLIVTCLSFGAATFMFQNAYGASTNLGSVGLTTLQQDTGDSVQQTCAGFVEAGAAPGSSALYDTCRSMVQTANDVNKSSGPTDDSLGLSREELAASLQQIATEEFANTETISTELSNNRLSNYLSRLTQVRGGVKGLVINGLNKSSTTKDSSLAFAGGKPLSGGAAGDEMNWNGFSVFINGNFGTGDADATDSADAYDFDTLNFTVGADYQITENMIMGLALSYFDISTSFDVTATVNGGSVDADGWGGAVYGTYYMDNWYLDGIIGYSRSSYDISRSIFIPSRNSGFATINDIATSSPDSDDYTFSFGGGYDFTKGGLTWGPYARLTYLQGEIDSYTETGAEASGLNLSVTDQSWESLTSVLGVTATYAMNMDFGVLVPQGRVGWIHEFEDDPDAITATYVDDPRNTLLVAEVDDPDSDYMEVGVGITAIFPQGWQAFINYDGLYALSDLSSHLFSLGVRWEF